jgi:hypothetical protein
MKKSAIIYLSIGLAAGAAGAVTVAAVEELPGLFARAVDRAVAQRVQQIDNGMPKAIRVGGGGGAE